jgi:hypothetical protein
VGTLESEEHQELVMNVTCKHMGLVLALGAALGTGFATVAVHSDAMIAIGVAIGMALGVFCWRKELPSLRGGEMRRLREELDAKSKQLRANS